MALKHTVLATGKFLAFDFPYIGVNNFAIFEGLKAYAFWGYDLCS